ncbi:hypothetical protein C9I47_2951 [Lysobacter maris]|uniref:DUF6438 domain-containing protein n=1 Tax=Marilutibacter maris TaxID=1605891 RepID=A0A2U9TL24_9GAMM|nr:hypothetical protein C9I47_2951 [Lysobacter maris]
MVLLLVVPLISCSREEPREVARPVDWPTCRPGQLLGHVPDREAVDTHRQGPAPVVRYPFGTEREYWGGELILRVDETGQVVCYSSSGRPVGDELPLSDTQRAALASLRYEPFVRGGQPVASIVTEWFDEEELPQTQVAMPTASLEDVRITLERTSCLGSCPDYRVEVRGDGQVVYEGRRFVDVPGRYAYRVPAQEVARLVERAREQDLWSLRTDYSAAITDHPSQIVTLDIGGEVHRIHDYSGRRIGMPRAVTEFENEIDAVARTRMWTIVSTEAVNRMQADGFDFASVAGRELLERALFRGEDADDEAMARLVELGVPVDDAMLKHGYGGAPMSLLELALLRAHPAVVEALIARGALETRGKPDQAKIDAAFRSAIAGGRFALVERIWNVAATRPHPSLYFDDVSDGEQKAAKRSPVTLLLSRPFADARPWEGRAIARWLIAQGCDMTASAADGATLLHIAAAANDAGLVRDLLDRGFDASTPGRYGLPALGSTEDEDIALMLLEAGTDLSALPDLRRQATRGRWQRVVTWLDAHDSQ